MKDTDLIQKCLKADQSAFKLVYERYAPYVYTICRRYFVAHDDCRDYLQEIFIEIFNSLKRFDSTKGTFKTWIRTITVNKILANRRKRKLEIVHIDSDAIGDAVYNEAIEVLSKEDLIRILADMPEGYRTILNLSVIDGYSHKEIGEMLNIKPETSRSQLLRAKNWLKANRIILKIA